MDAIDSRSTLDGANWNKLHTLAVFCTLGGTALDGYILGVVGGAIAAGTSEMQYTPVTQGIIGASALIGIFIGGLILGNAADRWGRKLVFRWNLIAFVALSILQFFAVSTWDLALYRVLIGVAIGVEYAVGAALLAEFLPARARGYFLSALQATWFVGFVGANFVALAWADANWRLVLASSAIPAIAIAIARIWLPESPRWLVSQGREAEARAILNAHFPAGTALPAAEKKVNKARFGEIFAPGMRKTSAYAGLFWACQVGPLFAIFTFITPVLNEMGLPQGFARDFIMNMLQLAGAVIFIWILVASRRRPFAISTFAIMFVTLLILGAFPSAPLLILATATGVYLFVASGASNLQFIYPSEMFPTRLRTSGVGFSAGMSRLGAALATYLMPVLIESIGVNLALLTLACFPLVGLVASIWLAPETAKRVLV